MDLETLARKYALKNAVEHGGECNTNAVMGQIFSEGDFEDKAKVGKVAGKVCSQVNQLDVEKQKEEMEEFEYESDDEEQDPLPDLEVGEDEEVVLRFAPNPNGPPHLGHARGMVVNGELKQKYDGKLILRFDDTDPVTKRPLKDAYEMYKEDYKWLGYEIDEVRYSSKNFEKYYEVAEQLIEKEKAYVCFCSQEEGQRYRKEGEACPHRDKSSQENMEDWSKMKNGDLQEGEATLKIKTDIDHKNPAVRDFVAFRIIEDPQHPVTGNKYSAWPMLDFQGAIEDQLMGTTHIVRGKDLRASTKRQKYIYDYLDWEYPDIMYWGNIEVSGIDAPMSTSSMKEMIEEGELEGWEDVRCGTLRALKRRGFQPEALREFYREMGVTENDASASIESLETANTRVIDEDSDRAFFVKNPVKIEVSGFEGSVKAEPPVHPDFPERGVREHELEANDGSIEIFIEKNDLEDGFVRLKGLCNAEITGGSAEFREGDHKVAIEKDAEFLHWAPANAEDAKLLMPDGSMHSGKLEPVEIDEGEIVQFERVGFAKKEKEGKFVYTHQ